MHNVGHSIRKRRAIQLILVLLLVYYLLPLIHDTLSKKSGPVLCFIVLRLFHILHATDLMIFPIILLTAERAILRITVSAASPRLTASRCFFLPHFLQLFNGDELDVLAPSNGGSTKGTEKVGDIVVNFATSAQVGVSTLKSSGKNSRL
jgi:hypothetical protein